MTQKNRNTAQVCLALKGQRSKGPDQGRGRGSGEHLCAVGGPRFQPDYCTYWYRCWHFGMFRSENSWVGSCSPFSAPTLGVHISFPKQH